MGRRRCAWRVRTDGGKSPDGDKAQAEAIAKSIAGGQVVSDQIAVVAGRRERCPKPSISDPDKGIELNLDAAPIADNLHDGVKYAVKNHVVTLTGVVDSQSKRRAAEGGGGFRSKCSAGGEPNCKSRIKRRLPRSEERPIA